MIDHLLRDLQVLRKADLLIGKIWFKVLMRRFSLFAFAGLIAVFGLGMVNVAGYSALQASLGPVWGAAVVAIFDFAVAIMVFQGARNAQPGPEIDLAFEVRKMAMDSIQTDAQDLKRTLDALGQDVTSIRSTMTKLVHDPWDVATQKLLIPAALSIVRGLRPKKEHA